MIKCISSVKCIYNADMLTEDNTWTPSDCNFFTSTADKMLKSRDKPAQVLNPSGISCPQWFVGICFKAHSICITTKSLFSQEFKPTVRYIWRTIKNKKSVLPREAMLAYKTPHKLLENIIIFHNKKILKALKKSKQNLRYSCYFNLH